MKATTHEKTELRNAYHVFQDRREAGRILARMLKSGLGEDGDAMVLAIPAGGVPVGLQIRRALKIPLDLIIVKKIPFPDNQEAGFGAVTVEGSVFLNQALLSRHWLSPSQIEEQIALVKNELYKRNMRLRGGRPFPDLSGKTVILVDDGLASGFTMMASVHTAREKRAGEIIVAVPTAPLKSIKEIEPLTEETYCPNIRDSTYFAVSDAYKHWYDISLEEVEGLIKEPFNGK
jgi:putative phosphoribosyl transferase